MTKGIETRITLKISPNQSEVTSSEIIENIFYRNRTHKDKKGSERRHVFVAKEVIRLAARKPEHLHQNAYHELSKEFGISPSEYHFILKRLKSLGIIVKRKSYYHADRKFARYLRKMALAMQEYCDDLGIPLD